MHPVSSHFMLPCCLRSPGGQDGMPWKRQAYLPVMCLFMALFLLIALPGHTMAGAKTLQPGVHYDLITPPVARSGPLPEVVEVFNFKCPHCFTLSPRMAAWAKKHHGRITYTALPVYWGNQTDMPARALAAAEFLGMGEAMKMAIFKAHFEHTSDIENVDEIIFLAEATGLEPESFHQHLQSFGVLTRMAQTKILQRAFGVRSTPTVVINGMYRVSPGKHARPTGEKVDYDLFFRIIETLAIP